MSPRLRAISAAAALLLAGCASKEPLDFGAEQAGIYAQPIRAEAPAWQPGSEWRYSDGYGLQVVRVEGPITTFRRIDDPTQWIARKGFLRDDSQSQTRFRKVLFEDLKPGAGFALDSAKPLTFRREFVSGDATHVHATSWTVERREHVKVPAGEFDCIVLVMRTRSLTSDWSGFERWWYSPDAQNYVRLEYQYGPEAAGSRVLTSYALAR